jgi:outer membrane protein OmpA-like peptidoglycan-associated protein
MAQRSSLTHLSLEPDEPPAANERTPKRAGGRSVLLLLLLLLAVALGGGGYVMLARMQALEQQVTALSARAVEAEARARQAAEKAAAAEAGAQRAAEGREVAEVQMAEARQDADASRAQADVARREASSAQETAARAQAEAQEIRKKAQAEIDRLHAALGSIAETRQTALGLVMNLGGNHLKFEFDKAELRPEDRELLSRIAGILMTASDTTVSVNGHTDDVGTDAYNQALSERRAQAVRDYLVKAGLPAEILSVTGHGKARPLVPGTSDAARAKNRRVELGIANIRLVYGGASSASQ